MRMVKIALTDPFCLYMLALFGIGVAAVILFLAGERAAAWTVSYGGTALVVLGVILYVAARDPDGRYGDDQFRVRLVKLLSFRRQ